MKTFISLLLLSTAAFANTCLSSASGNWNDASKWNTCGGVVPGSGDTAKIGQGHTITIPVGYHAYVGLSAVGNTQAASTYTSLSAAVTTTGQTAITVASATGMVNGNFIILQAEGVNTTEIVLITAGGGTTSLTVTRAQQGTVASTHATAAWVWVGSIPAISCNGSAFYGANGTGILVVNGWLTFRGNVEQGNVFWNVGPDAVLEHDSSLAPTPSTTHYRWVIGSYLFPDSARLVIRGLVGHRVIIRNAASSGTFYGFTTYFGAGQGSGQFDFEYVNIDGCGGPSPCTNSVGHNSTTASLSRCDHCFVSNSGYLSLGGLAGSVNVGSFTNTTVVSSTDSHGYAIRTSMTGPGALTLDTIYTDGVLVLAGTTGDNATGTHVRNIVQRANVLRDTLYMGGASFRVAEFDRFLRITDLIGGGSSSSYTDVPGGNLTRLMGLINSNSNPLCFLGPLGIAGLDDSVDGAYMEKIGTGADGDFLLGANGPATFTTIKNVVFPCAIADGLSGSLSSQVTGTLKKFRLLNNTYCGKDDGQGSARGFGYETAGSPQAGILDAARNNIVFCATNVACYLVHKGPTGTDVAGTYQNVDYNWKWNVATGPYLNVGTAYSPNPPGAHDSTGDPQFVQQRHFLDWGKMLKPSIVTWTDIVAEFAKMNDDTGFDSRFTILNAYTWLRDGYRPRNAAVMNAGDTGGRVGAMDAQGLPSSLVMGPGKIVGSSVIR